MFACECLTDRYAIVFNYRPQFRTNNRHTPLFHVAQYRGDIIGRERNLTENGRSDLKVEATAFRTATTDVDRD